MSRQTLLKKKEPKEKEKLLGRIEVAIDTTKNHLGLFDKGDAKDLFDRYRKSGMPPKSAARSVLRMLKKLNLDEIRANMNVD